MTSAIVGSLGFLAVSALAIKVAHNNSNLVQPIAQMFGIVCVSLVLISIAIG